MLLTQNTIDFIVIIKWLIKLIHRISWNIIIEVIFPYPPICHDVRACMIVWNVIINRSQCPQARMSSGLSSPGGIAS